MGGTTRVVIIDENKEPLSFITWTGSENAFFFSEDFAKGDIQKGIDKMIESAQQFSGSEKFTLSPEGYGLTVIDFKNKKLFCQTSYDSPSRLSLTSYALKLDGTYDYDKNNFTNLTQNNQIKVVNSRTKKIFSLIDFFGTNEPAKIIKLIDVIDARQHSNGAIKTDPTTDRLFEYYINPTNFDLHFKQYNNSFELFKHLYSQNYPISENDINNWTEFLNNQEEEDYQEKINDFLAPFKEKEHLNAALNETTKTNHKTKI